MSSHEYQDEVIGQEAGPEGQISHRTIWGMLGLGLAIGLIGMNLVIANPLIQRIDQMQREIAILQREMHTLVGLDRGVVETNNLLSNLNAQQQQTVEGQRTLAKIQELHATLIEQQTRNEVAMKGVERLVNLQDSILDQRELTVPAQKGLDQVAELQRRVIAAQPQIQAAETAIQGMVKLQDQIIRDNSDLSAAESTLAGLLNLKLTILNQGQEVSIAHRKYQEMVEVFTSLMNSNVDLKLASQSLGQLLEMKNRLVRETEGVIGAVQTLEILRDFQEEFNTRIGALKKMEQDLLSIVMMETSIGRVAKILEPMLQLGDLRRLSENELREAARSILDQRTTRLSDKSGLVVKPDPVSSVDAGAESPSDSKGLSTDKLVPEPQEILTK